MRSNKQATTWLVIAIVVLVAAPGAADQPTNVSRVFQLRHADVSEAIAAVQPLLSEHGSFTVKIAASRLTVQDRPEVVARIAHVLELLDRPPTQYRVRIELLGASVGEAVHGGALFVDPRVRKMFKYDNYHRIGGTMLVGAIGSQARAELGDQYQVSFLARSVNGPARVAPASSWSMATPAGTSAGARPDTAPVPPQASPRIALRQLTLVRSSISADGAEKQVRVLRSNVLLAPGQQTVIGAGASEDSSQALILIVRYELAGAS